MTVVRSVLRYDASGWRLTGALLRVLGLALAGYGGERVGGHGAAVLAAIGALYAGIASFGGVYEARLRRMLVATAAAAATTLLGCLVQPNDLATIAVVTLGTFVLALLASASADASQVALLATGLLVVFSGLSGARTNPVGNALLVLGGGVAQALVLMLFHPISRIAAERRAVAAVYASFARFSRARSGPLPDGAPSVAARDLLREGIRLNPLPERERLWTELELADALRGVLVGLARASDDEPTIWEALAVWFDAAEDTLARGRPLERRFPEISGSPSAAPWLRRFRRTVEAEETGHFPTVAPVPHTSLRAFLGICSIHSPALQHAARYALAVGATTAGYRLLHADHGYWAPLSLVFSLRPDFVGTVTRGLGRIVGTVGGVVLASAAVSLFRPGGGGLVGLVLADTWLLYALMGAWYVGYSACVGFWVVAALVLAGASAATVGPERIAATAVGSGIALAAALLWPRWEAGGARAILAAAFAAQADYADTIRQFAGPAAAAESRNRARLARLEAERRVAAARLEPRWGRGRHLEGVDAALARLTENASRILAAHVAALDPHESDVPEALATIAAEDRSVAADLMG